MTDKQGGIIAAHYIFLLKDDEDIPHIWSALTRGADVAAKPFSLDLAGGGGRHHSHGCSIINRAAENGREVCLGMLPELAVIVVKYQGRPGVPAQSLWSEVLAEVEADRERALGDETTVMGETTLLVTGELPEPDLLAAAAGLFPDGQLLMTEIDHTVGGGENPLWAYVYVRRHGARDFFVLSADQPGSLVESLLPEVDSLIKNLDKTVKYFAHQRQTIVKERLKVDQEVAAILHERVVSGKSTLDPGRLEQEIAGLSRMFGVLATDSHLVRQSAENIARDRQRLDRALARLQRGQGARHDATGHFYNRYETELANIVDEVASLDFSRGNAQAAIEVIRTQVELLRAGEEAALQAQTKEILDRSLLLQEERLALQVAAGFIEFVLVFYYTLRSWEGVVGQEIVDHVSPLLRLVIIAGIAAGATIGTHSLASSIQQKKYNKGVWLSAGLIVLSLTALVILSVINA